MSEDEISVLMPLIFTLVSITLAYVEVWVSLSIIVVIWDELCLIGFRDEGLSYETGLIAFR